MEGFSSSLESWKSSFLLQGDSFIALTALLPTFVSSQMTATHQLKTAVMSVAFAGRSLFLTSLSNTSVKPVDLGGGDYAFIELLMISLSNALAGMDANDPPKTLATMQLIGSIFSNVSLMLPTSIPV